MGIFQLNLLWRVTIQETPGRSFLLGDEVQEYSSSFGYGWRLPRRFVLPLLLSSKHLPLALSVPVISHLDQH